MANLPLAFSEILAGGLFVAAAVTGDSIADIVNGAVSTKPLPGAGGAASSFAGAAATAIKNVGSAIGGSPIPGLKPHAPTHQTEGLPGYPAYDYMAPAGSPVVAPASGTIIRLSGHDPAQGPTSGVHGPFGWSIYLKANDGKTYFLTHLGSLGVKVGQRVTQGTQIATVGDYAKWGGVDHVHQGVNG